MQLKNSISFSIYKAYRIRSNKGYVFFVKRTSSSFKKGDPIFLWELGLKFLMALLLHDTYA